MYPLKMSYVRFWIFCFQNPRFSSIFREYESHMKVVFRWYEISQFWRVAIFRQDKTWFMDGIGVTVKGKGTSGKVYTSQANWRKKRLQERRVLNVKASFERGKWHHWPFLRMQRWNLTPNICQISRRFGTLTSPLQRSMATLPFYSEQHSTLNVIGRRSYSPLLWIIGWSF